MVKRVARTKGVREQGHCRLWLYLFTEYNKYKSREEFIRRTISTLNYVTILGVLITNNP
jgi:hypothetical protein